MNNDLKSYTIIVTLRSFIEEFCIKPKNYKDLPDTLYLEILRNRAKDVLKEIDKLMEDLENEI